LVASFLAGFLAMELFYLVDLIKETNRSVWLFGWPKSQMKSHFSISHSDFLAF